MTSSTQLIARIQTAQNISIAHHHVAIRRPLAEAVEAAIAAACKSPHTERYYRLAIGSFIALLQRERRDVLRGTPLLQKRSTGKHGKSVFDYGNTPAAVLLLVDAPLLDAFRRQATAPHYNAARTFLSVAYRDNILTDEQARALGVQPYRPRQQRHQKPVGRRLSVAEVQQLRALNFGGKAGKRNKAILDVMLYLALRREEVANLQLSDFQQDRGRWTLTLIGKGDKPRKLVVGRQLYASLNNWLAVYGRAFGDDAPLFTRIRRGDHLLPAPLTPQAISDLVARLGAEAGLSTLTGDNRLTPHDLRRTCARNAYDNGAPLPAVQLFLGHSDPKTTAHYIGLTFDEAASVADFVNYG